jgi:ATP-dependent DNA helicase DinG
MRSTDRDGSTAMVDDTEETERVAALFDADGPLARHIEGYSPRAQQREMALKVAQAISRNSVLVCEAGTGTG